MAQKGVNMADITDYVMSAAIGTRVSSITKKSQDGFSAGGYAAFIQAVTGQPPTVVLLNNNRVRLVLSEAQKSLMQKWLDTQLKSSVAKQTELSSLEIELGPVLTPWLLKYAIPTAVFFVVTGWVAHHYMSR
jgi:hypothetical protein